MLSVCEVKILKGKRAHIMISKNYRQNKSEVMGIYDRYISICNKAEVTVEDGIRKQAEKIQSEVFNLMVLGEAKSGKSTFINAYLGKDVVPMDVRQCTSAIIKIHRGNEFKLVARTAGGGIRVIKGYDDIQRFLKNHAAISDKYRNIPITTINNEILIKYGKQRKKIPERILNQFLEKELKDNIYRMDAGEYKNLIRKYIKEKSQSWKDIVTEMDITFPLPEEMQGITIIDSPGVGAGGNVGQITENYINNANAIIFVKSLGGQALESTSFMKFLRATCREKQKAFLFLVFTGKSLLQGSDFVSLKEQAINMYRNDVDPNRILFVDSKMQLFLNKCKELGTEEKIGAYFDDLDRNNDAFMPAELCWFKSKGNIAAFNEKMSEASNFNDVKVALERFARDANYLQLIKFLDTLEKECKRSKESISQVLNVAKNNVDDQNALEDCIEQKKNQIIETFNKMNDGVSDIYYEYTDQIHGEGIIVKEKNKRRASYLEQLDRFRSLNQEDITDTTFNEMKKMTLDAIDDMKQFRRAIAESVIHECNEKLIQITDDPSQIQTDAYIPNFTEADFDEINREAEKQTSGYKEIEHGATFTKRTEKIPYQHLTDHVTRVADEIQSRLDNEIIPHMTENIINYVRQCKDVYTAKLCNHKDDLQREYNSLMEKSTDNKACLEKIEELEQNVSVFSKLIADTDKLRGDLNNYVGN